MKLRKLFTLDGGVWIRAKEKAKAKKQSLSSVINELLKEWLNK